MLANMQHAFHLQLLILMQTIVFGGVVDWDNERKNMKKFLEQFEYVPEHSSVWKEIVSRWGQADYDDLTKRKEHMDALKLEWDALECARNRKREYPSIEELTVALYDTDDKAAIDTKRAAVKTKWPKDNSGPVE